MPNTASTKKRMRQTDKRTLLNKDKRSAMRTAIRQLREKIEAKDQAGAEAALKVVYSAIDRCAKHNILHANTAGNKKAQLTRLVNRM